MKKKNFFTGSVFQFYVPEIKKYAFCKYFDFTQVSSFHGLLAQVYDKFSDVEENSIEDLKSSDRLFGARSMHKWPNLKKDTGWKSLGMLHSEDDNKIPDFKGVQAFPYMVEDESAIGPWYPIHNLTIRGENCQYNQVQHLETKILTVTDSLVERTGMEYCRINGLSVGDYYDLTEEGIRNMYWQMINIPIYRSITKETRGKAIK